MLVLLVLSPLGASGARAWIWNEVAPPATISSLAGTQAYTPDQQRFVASLKPSLDVLVGEGAALAKLSESRSRNIVELSVRAERYREAAAAIELLFRDNPAPLGLEILVAGLRGQIQASLAAIDGSISAIRAFNWDELAVQVATFSVAIAQITDMVGSQAAVEASGN